MLVDEFLFAVLLSPDEKNSSPISGFESENK